jgi:hypothetical protein
MRNSRKAIPASGNFTIVKIRSKKFNEDPERRRKTLVQEWLEISASHRSGPVETILWV